MGEVYSHAEGLEAEELEAILFDSDYVNTVEFLQGRLSRMLRQSALDAARREGKTLLTGDDAFEALDRLGLSKIYPATDDEDGDGS